MANVSSPAQAGATAKVRRLEGVAGFFDNPSALLAATEKARLARFATFDTFTPYPVHGLEHAQGLKRSPLPYWTFVAGFTGTMLGFALQYWTSAVDWPINVGGKPMNSWPASVPILFEFTVLLAALTTVAGMFLLNGLPNIKRKAIDPRLTNDRFALLIQPEVEPIHWLGVFGVEQSAEEQAAVRARRDQRLQAAGLRLFNEAEARAFLQSVGAQEIRTVEETPWF